MHRPRSAAARSGAFVFLAGLFLVVGAARAGCQSQLQLLSADVRDVALTEQQKQEIAGILSSARRHCWVHQEEAAMQYIAKARRVAGIGPPHEELDWETVPLESLEREPTDR